MNTLHATSRRFPDISLRLMMFTEWSGECLLWMGSHDRDGYGRAKVDGRTVRLTRLVWGLANGREPRADEVIRHRCDNPPCVNPAHLLIGSVADNNHDRVERNRGCVGERHHANRLTAPSVREIRERTRAGESCLVVAREFGVRQWTVQKIRDGVTWKHLA